MSSTRFHIGPTFVFDIHKQPRWRLIKCKSICRWHFIIPIVCNINTSAGEVNNVAVKINKWAYKWTTCFNPDSIKQAQEVIFTRKISKEDHP